MYVIISRRCSIWASISCIACEYTRRTVYHKTRSFSKDIKLYNTDKTKRSVGIERSRLYFPDRMASTSSDVASKGKENKLASEKSPYLLQHARNPVEWYPWGDEAIRKAQREDKLIFLSVGYSTCHWCHVMERESFENPEIAAVMNKYFVNIKVDREERPDIDRIYMTFVQAISGRGGWPMSVFLTPNLNPITGGTYYPPTDKYGQPGFKSILTSVAHKWIESRRDILESGSRILDTLKRLVDGKTLPQDQTEPSIRCGTTCVQQLAGSYETEFGGFTDAPKFPQPVNFNFLFHMYARDPTSETGKECSNMCLHTLKKMANGGIHDHVGQGFARYSVDGKWHVPHFEKMLYDQAQLLGSYTDALVITKNKFFSDIVDDIVKYVTRDLRHKEGGFFNAEDADSLPSQDSTEKKEGAFYVWTWIELDKLLSTPIPDKENLELSEIFCYHFNVKPEGNVDFSQDPHGELTGKNVLIVYGSLEETAENFELSLEDTRKYLDQACDILYKARSLRPRPHLDDKIITSWNGLMISSLARAGFAMNNKEYIKYATEAAEFVKKYLFNSDENILLRSCYNGEGGVITQPCTRINGFHVDYAFMTKGLLDLYEATFDISWLEFAENLQHIQDDLFWDSEGGAYFSTTKEDSKAILRLKDDHDGAEPSSNSVACHNLLRLSYYLNQTEFSDKASRLLVSFRKTLTQAPAALPELVSSLMHYHDSMTQIYIVGKKDAEDVNRLLDVIRERFIPGRVLLLVDHDDADNMLFRSNKVMQNMKSSNNHSTAYVCRRHVCSLPVTESDKLSALLDERQ